MDKAERFIANTQCFLPDTTPGSQLVLGGLADSGSQHLFTHSSSRTANYIVNESRSYADESGPDDLVGDSDVPLNGFDRQLLSEQPLQHQLQAEQGLIRISLFPKSTHASVDISSDLIQATLRDRPSFGHTSSSSPMGLISSPKVSALRNHIPHTKQQDKSRMQQIPSPQSHPHPLAAVIDAGYAIPNVQGIRLVPATDLPDRFRSLFPYPLFNAVQSKCFPIAYGSDINLVVSAPTGSGKTVVMEFAICQLMVAHKNEDIKVVYQAPTKSLCVERYRDWQVKFAALGLQCAELTGDTESNQLHGVQRAAIIVTTPEKWDSVTRKWKDNAKLMKMVKLFLIDEVHILKESRGANLEAVVSRMKSVGSKVRFVALSATIPNSQDIARWLGRNMEDRDVSAHREVFDESFRPVQLRKIVKGYSFNGNDWAFEAYLDKEVPKFIARYSQKKPIIIFCCTRSSAIKLATTLSQLWQLTSQSRRLWNGPETPILVANEQLHGVAFHHAGLDSSDRRAVELGFLNGNIKIICSTSTLAIGVNLPCYLVIIKGTVGWSDHGSQEYPDLEIMQMLGRAGRPQFDKAACAIILTRDNKVKYYEKMVSGEELLESCLHQNLIDHLNSEIGLGTVYDMSSAKRWLAGTFLFVRLRQNPDYYQLKDKIKSNDENELLERICERDINLLQQNKLVSNQPHFESTEFGNAMARYYVKFDTMKIFTSMPAKAKLSDILSALAGAAEFRDIRVKQGEKAVYKELNGDNGIKYPIKVDIALPAHKVSLIVQAELGGVGYPSKESLKKYASQYRIDLKTVFSHVNRLIRCFIDCKLYLGDSVSSLHALELGRSLAARVWDDTCLQLKQIDDIGPIAVRRLAEAGISRIEMLNDTEASRIELILGKKPPFGLKLLDNVAQFPGLRVSVKQVGKVEHELGGWIRIKFQAEIQFLNQNLPKFFKRKPVYVCFLAETCHGKVIDFRRFGANQLQNDSYILLSVELDRPTPSIKCHVMCDEIAGTSKYAELRLEAFPSSWFPTVEVEHCTSEGQSRNAARNSSASSHIKARGGYKFHGFGGHGRNHSNLLAHAVREKSLEVVEDIDDLLSNDDTNSNQQEKSRKRKVSQISQSKPDEDLAITMWRTPFQLESGRWTCQHDCIAKNKLCRHGCCRKGVSKPRKQSKMNTGKPVEISRAAKDEETLKTPQKLNLQLYSAQEVSEERERKKIERPNQRAITPEKMCSIPTELLPPSYPSSKCDVLSPQTLMTQMPGNVDPPELAEGCVSSSSAIPVGSWGFWVANYTVGNHGEMHLHQVPLIVGENEDDFDESEFDWDDVVATIQDEIPASHRPEGLEGSKHKLSNATYSTSSHHDYRDSVSQGLNSKFETGSLEAGLVVREPGDLPTNATKIRTLQTAQETTSYTPETTRPSGKRLEVEHERMKWEEVEPEFYQLLKDCVEIV